MGTAASGSVATTTQQPTANAGLRRHTDFGYVWAAESASLVGTEISALALPLLAITLLNASAVQMGFLAAAGSAPFFFCSLLAGVWVDRHRRRPILIAADLVRAGLLLSIPLAWWAGRLRIEHLYVVAFVVGMLTVLFEVAHYAYVPSLVGREHVVDANSKLQISHSAAESSGPGPAGLLVQLLSAPVAIVVDAASYLVSALLLRRIKRSEPALAHAEAPNLRRDVAAGLRMLLGHRLLRPIVLGSINAVLFLEALSALFILFAIRELDISPFLLGLIFATAGAGSIAGALFSTRTAQRLGVGWTIIGGWFIIALAWLVISLITGAFAVPLIMAVMLLRGVAATIANIQQWSLRQLVTPDALQGRVTASHRFLVYGAYPFGAVLGGVLGDAIGLRPAMTICALGLFTAPLWLIFSPLRRLREQPAQG